MLTPDRPPFLIRFASSVPWLLLLAAQAAAQSWLQRTPSFAPAARAQHAMAYDSVRERTVLFGGDLSGSGATNQTLEWDGDDWTLRVPAAWPAARVHTALAFDSVRGRCVLFGGAAGATRFGDTWEWDGTTWSLRTPATAPSPRAGHALAYDRARARIVLFGGNTGVANAETWTWDGTTWTQAAPTAFPSARVHHAMAWDDARGVVVLFGGSSSPGGQPDLRDVWEWDGTNWVDRTPSPVPATWPAARGYHALAFDPGRRRTYLFGGYTAASGRTRETREWDGTNWATISVPPSLSTRMDHAMAFDARGRIVLFGGDDGVPNGETWQLTPAVANGSGTGCGAPPLTAAAPSGSRPVLGGVVQVNVTNVPPGQPAFMALGSSNTAAGGIPLPLDLASLGMPGCWLYHNLVVFAVGCPSTGTTSARLLYVLPSTPALLEAHLYMQAWAPAPGVNAQGMITSNLVDLQLGG